MALIENEFEPYLYEAYTIYQYGHNGPFSSVCMVFDSGVNCGEKYADRPSRESAYLS
jgi:hypothetical protein